MSEDRQDVETKSRSATALSSDTGSGGANPFLLTVRSHKGRIRVLAIRGREAVSRPFRFDVEVAIDAPAAPDPASLLGEPSGLVLHVGGGDTRVVRGVLGRVEAAGVLEQGLHAFRLRLVPRLWLLGRRKTSRVFQGKTVPEIVGEVLDAARLPHRAALKATYFPRTYCVQYQETDLAFVARLCAEEGIFYFFEHGHDETVVLGDGPHYAPIQGEPRLRYRYDEGGDWLAATENRVGRFALRRAVRTGSVLQGDYDFLQPRHAARAEAKAGAHDEGAGSDVQLFEAAQLRAYEHDGKDAQPDVDAATAEMRLEQHRRRAVTAEGASACRRLSAGYRFQLVEHTLPALDGEYVVQRVDHVGRSPEVASRDDAKVYTNAFACVPAAVALRPKRPARVLKQVTETAVVVGPEGQEIYTDEHGRVKVQFPWDLAGKKNEHSSCWVRVAQAWAGAGWGTQFIPRIGMEVVVTFIGGDVDRPLITGCVPNALNMPPFSLPKNSARSGFRTRTVRGGGFSELSFDDAPGQEQVHLRAQGRLDEVVLKDHSITVGGAEHSRVAGGRTEILGGDVQASVAGSRIEQIAGDFRIQVAGELNRMVGKAERAAVSGDASIEVTGTHTTIVHGNQHVLVGQGAEEGHSFLLVVNGDYNVGASQGLNLKAQCSLTLSVGDSSIELTAKGIKLKGKTVTIEGANGASMKVAGHALKMDKKLTLASDTVEIFSSKGSLIMDDEIHIDGKKVNLNCKPRERDTDDDQAALPEEGIVTFVLKHKASDAPMTGVTVLVGTPSGEVIEAKADENGKVSINGKKGERYMVVGVRADDHVFGHEQS